MGFADAHHPDRRGRGRVPRKVHHEGSYRHEERRRNGRPDRKKVRQITPPPHESPRNPAEIHVLRIEIHIDIRVLIVYTVICSRGYSSVG